MPSAEEGNYRLIVRHRHLVDSGKYSREHSSSGAAIAICLGHEGSHVRREMSKRKHFTVYVCGLDTGKQGLTQGGWLVCILVVS